MINGQIKERNYSFDNLRGLLIWCIPISHFTRVGGDFSQASLSGIVYITINVFVMEAFVFLSGYFSKNPDRARETSYKTFLLPYLVWTFVFFLFRYAYFGNANLNFFSPPFALWFLWSLFFYRFFLKDLIKIKYILPITFILYLLAGQVIIFGNFMALGRTVSYLPFFILGYYINSDNIKQIQVLKKYQVFLLGFSLALSSVLVAFFVDIPVGFYLLKAPASALGISWYSDIICRAAVVLLAFGWIVFLLNILPNKKNYLTYVGISTMPIYIFHLFIRYIIEENGFPNPNPVVYYSCIFGLATLCVLIFSSKPFIKVYDKLMDSIYKIMPL
jgi:fucose 4-O-acetylase-like acetyltransferase